METYEVIIKRQTIRRFKQRPIPFDMLEKLVIAVRLALSASNLQPLRSVRDILHRNKF